MPITYGIFPSEIDSQPIVELPCRFAESRQAERISQESAMPPRTSLSHCLSLLSEVIPPDLATMSQDLPVELIEQALAGTGAATVRERRLPAQQVVWLVLGLAMF